MTTNPPALFCKKKRQQAKLYQPLPASRTWGQGVVGSIGLHLFALLFIAILSWIFQVKTIEELMKEGGSIALSGPAAEPPMEITLEPELPPPPTDNPEFIQQIIKPPIVPPPAIPQPKPVVIKRPAYTASNATGSGESAATSQLVIGSSGFPKPPYPYEAKRNRTEGTVLLRISFNSSGHAQDVEVATTSGSHDLDNGARNFIRSEWHDPSFAGRTVTVPISYVLAH